MLGREKRSKLSVGLLFVLFTCVVSLSFSVSPAFASEKAYIKVSGDPHGTEEPCELCKKAVVRKLEKMKECKKVSWEGDILEITLEGGRKTAQRIVKMLNKMGFRAELIAVKDTK